MFRWQYLASVFFLYHIMGGFSVLDRLVYGEWDFKQSDKLGQGLNLILIAAELALFSNGYHRTRRIGTGGWLLIGLAGFLILSAGWSIDPATTARRGVLFLLWALGAIGVAGSFEGDDFIRLFGNVCLLAAILSVAVLAVSPHLAVMLDSTLRGVYTHKSVLGQAMATGALPALYLLRVDKRSRLRALGMLLLFLVLALAARSTTSLLVIFAFVSAEAIIFLFRRGGTARAIGIGLVIVLVPSLIMGAMFPDQILEMLGKDPTLTGRSDLWAYVIQAIAQRPILGWGLMAFWSNDNPAAVNISSMLGWIVPQAHNGLLELLLSVGIVGTLFFAALLARNALIASRCLRNRSREVATTLLLCCMGILLIGMTESVLIDPAQPAANLLFIGGLICERTLRKLPQHSQAHVRARPNLGRPVAQPPTT